MTRVLAVVGTRGPFPRLIEALALLAAETGWQVCVQHASDLLPSGLEGWRELPRAEVLRELALADAVVCHGGSGTIRDALAAGHRPIVVARLARHAEHVNDHQLELVAALGERVVPIEDLAGERLTGALKEAIVVARRQVTVALPGDSLRLALGEELAGIARSQPARRTRLLYGIFGRLFPSASR